MFVNKKVVSFILILLTNCNCNGNHNNDNSKHNDHHYVKLVKRSENSQVSSSSSSPIIASSNNNIMPGKINDDERGEQEDFNCPILPTINIISYNRSGFEPERPYDTELVYVVPKITNIIYSHLSAHIVLQCMSSSPIEWIFDGLLHPSISSIQVFYDTTSMNSEKSCFRITIALETTKKSTGKYWCRTLDQKYATSWYLYGDGNSPPSLLYHGNEFDIIPNGTHSINLPCQVVNPNLHPQLTKGDTSVIAIDNSVPYNPQEGFALDLTKIPNPFGRYKCSAGDDPIILNIQQPPDFIVTPKLNKVAIGQQEVVTLICEGKDPVGLQGFIDDNKVTFLDYTEGSEFKYRVQYDFSGVEDAQVICVDLTTKNVHHTWTIQVIDKQTQLESGILYNPSTKQFICHSITKDQPIMSIGKCSNPLECTLMDKCYTWNAPFKLTRIRQDCRVGPSRGSGTPCIKQRDSSSLSSSSSSSEEYDNKMIGCVSFKKPGSSGVVYCRVEELDWTSKMYYFIGLKSKQVISDWRAAEIEELVNINFDLKINHNHTGENEAATISPPNLYVHESVEFTCSATKFLFTFGFKWMFKMKDGSFIQPKGENTVNSHDENIYSQTTHLLIENANIEAVVCLVHFWNTTEWLNVSKVLSVEESIKPVILLPHGDDMTWLFSTGSNESIVCKASGVPSPNVGWYRNKERIESQTELIENENGPNIMYGSIFNFGHVDADDEGEYECIASNVAGSATRSVLISVSNNNSRIYTGIGISVVIFLIFVIIVGVLWWKLKVNKEIIRRLTQKEYEQFRKGDKKAVLNAPNGYIRAQFMPYDDNYEIPEENLDIDKESILGTGEYGVVLKGTLRQNNTEEEVAVKTNKTNSDSNHLKALLCELKILTYIGWHGNVINLRGAVTRHLRERDVYVVVEYCRLGSLENYLRENKVYFLNQIVNDKIDLNLTFNTSVAATNHYQPMQYTMSTTDLITWSYQISSGMEYLANKKIIHGDLAARNLLLTEDKTIKITDFGLSKHLYNDCSNYVCHTPGPLPWKWLAPETLQYQKFSTQSDVWAFAITLWEIFSLGQVPYPGISCDFNFKQKLLNDERMDKPEFANDTIWSVIQSCWSTLPNDRPLFPDLRKYFHWLLHHWDDPRGPPKLMNDEVVRYINPNELILFED